MRTDAQVPLGDSQDGKRTRGFPGFVLCEAVLTGYRDICNTTQHASLIHCCTMQLNFSLNICGVSAG